jgi:ubiquinone/menaquinone biosynthesis C-methylase UbiE
VFSNPKDILQQCGISQGAVVGDFGTGTGAYAHEAASLVGARGVVYAFDVQKDHVQRLSRTEHNREGVIRPLWVDLEMPRGTGLADTVLDLAIVANTLFQIEDKKGFIAETFRVVRPGGRLLLIDWEESFGGMGPHVDRVINADVARAFVEASGWVFDKTIEAGSHHYGYVFRKPLAKSTS